MTPKVYITVQKIARMRVAGIRDGVIAAAVGLTQAGLSRIVALPEYREVEQCVLDGTVSKMDEVLAENSELMKQHFKRAVPVALQGLLDAARQRRDLKSCIAASAEILDRDPNKVFTKDVVHNTAGQPVSASMIDGAAHEADAVASKMTESAKQEAKVVIQ